MISVSLNTSQKDRIISKLQQLARNASTAKGSRLTQVVLTLADQYGDAIRSVMGVVDGVTGGSASSTPFMGSSFSVAWEGLSERTINHKQQAGLTMEIWKATGETQKAVKTKEFHVPYREVQAFVGIDRRTDESAWLKAMNNEYGWYDDGSVDGNSRALFTLANEMFKERRYEILAEVRRTLFEGVKWGS